MKKILALIMVVVLCIGIVPTVASAITTTTLSVVADKTTVQVGDIVKFSVYCESSVGLYGFEAVLDIPGDGMSYIENTGKVINNIGGDSGTEFRESDKQIWFENSTTLMEINGLQEIASFQCSVDKIGTFTVGLKDTNGYDEYFEEITPAIVTTTITVNALDVIANNITLTPTTLTLTEGNTAPLSATLTPADSTDKITWSSSNESIATVDENGVVTAVSEGTATITAKANDAVSADCTVTVEKAACTHESKTTHPAVSSTCNTLGNNLYYTCNDCEKVFKADGTTETTVEAEKLTEYGEHVEATPATCTTLAVCSVCNQGYGELAAHDYKAEWNQGNANGHWHDCKNCSAHDEEQAHIPGAAATETTAQICTECGYVIAPATGHITHTADTSVWLHDETTHWHKCVGCDEKMDVTAHTGGEATCNAQATCSVCEVPYGEVNATNHKGETEIRNASAANCKDNGYTGDTYCKNCGARIADGTVIPATDAHTDANGDELCDVCNTDLSCPHNGATELRDNAEATCGKDGYTGDTYCLDCGKKIADGSVIPATGAHTGGEATCIELAKCSVCEASYGTVNAANHKGETEVRDTIAGTCDKEGYSGDTYCVDCNAKIKDGYATPVVHEDENGDNYCDICEELLCAHDVIKYVDMVFATCAEGGYSGDIYCDDCGMKIADGFVTSATGEHSPSDWIVGKEATETEAGYKYKKCTVCGTTVATEEIAVNPFADISKDKWYYDDVLYVYRNGLMIGIDTNKFSPDIALSRAQLVTILWRLDDEAKAESAAFTDVADGMWYTEAIDWAAANGIVLGYDNGRFGPDDTITREQVMLILNRYAEYKGWTTDASTMDTVNYKYSTWAEKGVLWAAANGMFDGIGVDVTDLTVTANRAEIAAYLKLFVENIAE